MVARPEEAIHSSQRTKRDARSSAISLSPDSRHHEAALTRMQILLLNLYYPPDTSATAKMAHTVVDTVSVHHQVTVLCGRPSYDPSERRAWRLYQTEIMGRARVIRVGSTAFPRFDLKKRVLNYLSYTALAASRALFVNCDVVRAMTDPPLQGLISAFR